ncbi:MAG: BTB/POZ domain-containing protein [Chlamydiales bacterium]
MANLVNFDANFKFVNLKSVLYLDDELRNIPTQQWKNKNSSLANQWVCSAFELDPKFIEMVVSTVKKTHFTTHQISISLQSLLPPPSGCCPAPLTKHLTIIAQILYRSFGIEIQQVDDMKSPQIMVVTWHRDNLWLNPPSPYLVQSRKEGFRTDCTLKFGEKLFPVHGTVLAAKSSYFEKMFKSQCKEAEFGAIIPIVMEAVEEKSVEMLLDYFYTGELDLKDASITRIDNLVNLSSYFDMPRLAQICFEHLCKNVNADNLKEYIAVARYYDHKELESALARHIENEVTLDNSAELIQLGKAENIEGLEVYCTEGIKKLIKKIDYEPMGFGKSTQLKYFVKFLDAIIETHSSLMLPPLIARMKKVLSHPGYGTHLEKLIEYLALTCEYQTRFDWLPSDIPNDLIPMKGELYKDVLESIKSRQTGQYKDYFKESLFEECLAVAEKYQLEDLKDISSSILMKKT